MASITPSNAAATLGEQESGMLSANTLPSGAFEISALVSYALLVEIFPTE
jgi:hypothetical protein